MAKMRFKNGNGSIHVMNGGQHLGIIDSLTRTSKQYRLKAFERWFEADQLRAIADKLDELNKEGGGDES